LVEGIKSAVYITWVNFLMSAVGDEDTTALAAAHHSCFKAGVFPSGVCRASEARKERRRAKENGF